jgi:hypothetical protein
LAKLLLRKISCLLCLCAGIAASGIGGRGDALLRGPLSAHATALGGAFSARPSHAAAYWNPSYTSLYATPVIALGTARKSLDRVETYASFDAPVEASPFGYSLLFRHSTVSGLDSLRDAEGGFLEEGRNYSLALMAGLSMRMNAYLSLGFSSGWKYNILPADFSGEALSHRQSSGFGGIHFFATYLVSPRHTVSAGVRDLFLHQTWVSADNEGGVSYSITDTALSPIVISSALDAADYPLRFVTDMNIYVFENGFSVRSHPFLISRMGVELELSVPVVLRLGMKDILLDGFILNSDADIVGEKYTPTLTSGFGLETDSFWNFTQTRVNYSFAGSGIKAGFNHYLDVVFYF